MLFFNAKMLEIMWTEMECGIKIFGITHFIHKDDIFSHYIDKTPKSRKLYTYLPTASKFVTRASIRLQRIPYIFWKPRYY